MAQVLVTYHKAFGRADLTHCSSSQRKKCKNLGEQLYNYAALIAQSCLTLRDPTDCSLPGFSVHGILQARTLEWVAVSFSRGTSQPRDRTLASCLADRFFTVCEPQGSHSYRVPISRGSLFIKQLFSDSEMQPGLRTIVLLGKSTEALPPFSLFPGCV